MSPLGYVILSGAMFRWDRHVTKRQLGILLLLGGVFGFIAVLSIDILDVGREGGIGLVQGFALLACVAVAIVGATLIPLGDKPA
jgi:Mg/Co/Ni transporter MgtE